jgi:DNA-binding response OmpR family regulator
MYFSPQEALENFKVGRYDVAVIDVSLPSIDGFELYDRLRKVDDNLHACFLTGLDISIDEYTRNFDSKRTIVRKPVYLKELKRIITYLTSSNLTQRPET